jgi:hypothetical protein
MAAAAALYAISTQPPFRSIGVISATRNAADVALLHLYKTAAGTGRWQTNRTRPALVLPPHHLPVPQGLQALGRGWICDALVATGRLTNSSISRVAVFPILVPTRLLCSCVAGRRGIAQHPSS